MKFLITGIGNIGDEYAHTRHNIGFDILDFISARFNLSFTLQKLAFKTELRHKGKIFHLIKPSTYVNLSGKAVKYWANHHDIPVENIFVVTDDLALPVGKIRIRKCGSNGGHNGLRSIIETMGSEDFPRLRFGIGNDFPKGMQSQYVLGRWNAEEKPLIDEKIQIAADSIIDFGLQGLERTMNIYNSK